MHNQCIFIFKQLCLGNCCSHPLKARADGKRVVMLPLILFSDDTSGNRSKKWHKFESWYRSTSCVFQSKLVILASIMLSFFKRFESFNSNVRMYNVFGN